MERTGEQERTGGNDPIRVVLADDHAQVREGLKEMLLTDGGIEVVGEAADGAQAIEVAGRVLPDVLDPGPGDAGNGRQGSPRPDPVRDLPPSPRRDPHHARREWPKARIAAYGRQRLLG